jgi:hypothetical protein
MAPFKFTASQAHSIHQYKKLKIEVLKCNADIFFNRQCVSKKIIPNNANMKVPVTSPAAHKTTKSRPSKLKMKSNFYTKNKINKELYRAHLEVAQEWGNLWYLILESVQESINTEMDKKYKNIYQKLDRLERIQPPPPNQT